MHKVIYTKWDIDYIDSSRVKELFEKINTKKHIMVGENIRDSLTIKSVVKLSQEQEMIYNLLKNESEYINREVNNEIKLYNKEITPQVIKNMIIKYSKK